MLRCKEVAGRVGLDPAKFGIKTFRSTNATRISRAGLDVRTVQHWVGHKSLETTMRYLVPATEVHDRLDRVVVPGSAPTAKKSAAAATPRLIEAPIPKAEPVVDSHLKLPSSADMAFCAHGCRLNRGRPGRAIVHVQSRNSSHLRSFLRNGSCTSGSAALAVGAVIDRVGRLPDLRSDPRRTQYRWRTRCLRFAGRLLSMNPRWSKEILAHARVVVGPDFWTRNRYGGALSG